MNTWTPDDQMPYDDVASEAQAEAIRQRLPVNPRVLDLGCGTGRVATRLGDSIVLHGVDRDEALLKEYASRTGAETSCLDFVSSVEAIPAGPFDAVLLLGNTLMEVVNPLHAYQLIAGVATRLTPQGVFVIDDFPVDLWQAVSDGLWCNGIDESGRVQMVWAAGDPVFTLRYDEDVDPQSTFLGKDDRRFRLYSWGELTLYCALNGLSGPTHDVDGHVMVCERATV